MSTATSTGFLAVKTKTTSPVWAHFGLGASDKGKARSDDVVCHVCKACAWSQRVVTPATCSRTSEFTTCWNSPRFKSCKSEGGTQKNGRAQLRVRRNQDSQPLYNSSAFQKGRKYEQSSKKWKQLTDSVTFRLAKDMLPLYSVEKERFRKMLNTLDPQYELQCHKYFSEIAVPALYVSTHEKVNADLQHVEFLPLLIKEEGVG